ncbi:MAG: site-specific integrase, partial [Pseudomonadota bacterium]
MNANGTPFPAPKEMVDQFLDTIWMERGLSKNTLAAYRADLTALTRWLQARDETHLAEAQRADLLAFIAERAEKGARPRSTARQLSRFRR